MDALIRPFRPDDLDGLFVLDYRCYAAPYRFAYPQLLGTLQQPEVAAVVIEGGHPAGEKRGDVIGGLIVRGNPLARELTVVSLMVAPEHRRLGLGRRLLERASAHARSSLWTAVTVPLEQANLDARAFLTAHNFVDTGVGQPYYASPDVGTLWRQSLEDVPES